MQNGAHIWLSILGLRSG